MPPQSNPVSFPFIIPSEQFAQESEVSGMYIVVLQLLRSAQERVWNPAVHSPHRPHVQFSVHMQGAQIEPPQSIPVSSWFCIPSEQFAHGAEMQRSPGQQSESSEHDELSSAQHFACAVPVLLQESPGQQRSYGSFEQ